MKTSLIIALLLLILTALIVRMVWRALRNLFQGHWGSLFPGSPQTPAQDTRPK